MKNQFYLIISVACIAVLFPKLFYPMLMNQTNPVLKDKDFRTISDRPGNVIHPGMKKPVHPTVPSMEKLRSSTKDNIQHRPGNPTTPGVPGPINRMITMSSTYQSKTAIGINSVFFPFYTLGILAFFGYTLVKIFFKNQKIENVQPEKVEASDPSFLKKVFSFNKDNKKEKKKTAEYNEYDYITRSIQNLIQQTEKQLLIAQVKAARKRQMEYERQNRQQSSSECETCASESEDEEAPKETSNEENETEEIKNEETSKLVNESETESQQFEEAAEEADMEEQLIENNIFLSGKITVFKIAKDEEANETKTPPECAKMSCK